MTIDEPMVYEIHLICIVSIWFSYLIFLFYTLFHWHIESTFIQFMCFQELCTCTFGILSHQSIQVLRISMVYKVSSWYQYLLSMNIIWPSIYYILSQEQVIHRQTLPPIHKYHSILFTHTRQITRYLWV